MEVANFCAVMDTLIDQDALISALLKSVSIKYLEQDVTCLNERVFIQTMHHLLTNCNQSILPAMVCRLKTWFISLTKCVQRIIMQTSESFVKSVVLK